MPLIIGTVYHPYMEVTSIGILYLYIQGVYCVYTLYYSIAIQCTIN